MINIFPLAVRLIFHTYLDFRRFYLQKVGTGRPIMFLMVRTFDSPLEKETF